MIILDITYTCELKSIEENLKEHISFLDKYYKLNKFICSGRKKPRVGGIILCNTSKDECERIIKEDPFYIRLCFNMMLKYSLKNYRWDCPPIIFNMRILSKCF